MTPNNIFFHQGYSLLSSISGSGAVGSKSKAPCFVHMTSASASGRNKHHRRRIQRQREEIWELLASLPEPFGFFASQQQRILSSRSGHNDEPQKQNILDGTVAWQSIPAACDPCKLLDHQPNRGKKYGKTVLEQIEDIGYTQDSLQTGDDVLRAPGRMQAKDSRGLKKRWQVRNVINSVNVPAMVVPHALT
jgi:hypothetical protein